LPSPLPRKGEASRMRASRPRPGRRRMLPIGAGM
jgi:hypothetical protein